MDYLRALVSAEAFMLAVSVSIDAFASGLSYGGKIKIPAVSVAVISAVCGLALGIAFLFGGFVKHLIPRNLTNIVCFVILFILGLLKLFDALLKSVIRRHNKIQKEFKFSAHNIHFILSLYTNPEKADVDLSRSLSPIEAASLAAALSIDSLAAGLGAAMGGINGLTASVYTFAVTACAIIAGRRMGQKIAARYDVSWFGGVVLIILAFQKLF